MQKQQIRAIGLMSGTSLDGLDLACVDYFLDEKGWKYHIVATSELAYNDLWHSKLSTAHNLPSDALYKLNRSYGKWLGQQVNDFIKSNNLKQITIIASHGHTVFHQPKDKITLQIGDGAAIAGHVKLPVVCNFRLQDVLLGGQGAPLVPIGDKLLFGEYGACLNLGGFANISFDSGENRMAFDICATNIVLNTLAQREGLHYDVDGALARSGNFLPELFADLNALPFFKQKAPKSLGREWVDAHISPLLKNVKTADALHTFVHHIAHQIACAIPNNLKDNILISGGGAFNLFLVETISQYLEAPLIIPKREIITHKEAIIFGFLGVLRWLNKHNCLASVTGAPFNHCSGNIYLPAHITAEND